MNITLIHRDIATPKADAIVNASNSSQSIQIPLLDAAAKLLAVYDIVQGGSADFDLPIYSADPENSAGIPQAAADFYQMMANAMP